MIWLNPWAWAGVAALAIPIAVHLIGRRRPRLVRFPTLRFLPETRLASRARRRIYDPWLLALRIAIVIAAVTALAGPLVLAGDRSGALPPVTRAIVVDSSASMSRATPAGGEAIAEARERAERQRASSTRSRVIESARLRAGVADAIGWLDLQSGRRELVLISDFQAGALDRNDLAAVPAAYGVRVERVAVASRERVDAGTVRLNESTLDVTLVAEPAATTVAWTRREASVSPLPLEIDARAPAPDTSWTAIERAAAGGGLPAGRTAGREVVVTTTPGSEAASEGAPWMFDVIEAAHRVLADEERALVRFSMPSASRLVAIVDPSTDPLTAARLVRALAGAASDRPAPAELEPAVIPDSETESWTREPGSSAGLPPGADDSDARWIWALVLILIGAETVVRRRNFEVQAPPAALSHEDRHDARVA